MSVGCKLCVDSQKKLDRTQRNVLWIALVLNASMFFAEVIASFVADSVALKADAIDFLGDSANYGVSLFVLGMSVTARARASFLKAFSMGAFGFWVIATAIYNWFIASTPEPRMMSSFGVAAMAVNLLVAILLFRFRNGDSNMRSVWLCTRNDVLGNIAVIGAATGVFITASRWPDLLVAMGMGALAVHSAIEVVKAAREEVRQGIV